MGLPVCVLVATYNSPIDKLKQTLYSIVNQKNIEFDLVISDDGSTYNYKVEIETFLQSFGFFQYHIIMHNSNQGTVKNVYDGLLHTTSEYVFCLSPGDYFYKETVLHDIYNYAKKTRYEYVFGRAIYYSRTEDKTVVIHKSIQPYSAKLLCLRGIFGFISQVSFFTSNMPLGATFLRKRALFLHDLKYALGTVKYVEDFYTSSRYLLSGREFGYFDSDTVWYEYGEGISTRASKYWEGRLMEDFMSSMMNLLDTFPESRILRAKMSRYPFERLKYIEVSICGFLLRILYACIRKNKELPEVNINKINSILKIS